MLVIIGTDALEPSASVKSPGAVASSSKGNFHAALLKTHFNSVTAENEMKFESLQRTEGNFTYDAADRIVSFGVTFWGIADDNTWLSEFSSGRKDFPLLFDINHDPKPAYDAVVDF
ncbi:endo-1,4-beta-xylanase [Sorangium sp. So ce341]|uniref:endo-1,4-beta-xylanase n=1 Tax=Sorangium sp. So ce341 TaxID=3133302 RepID=UPI003F5F92E2